MWEDNVHVPPRYFSTSRSPCHISWLFCLSQKRRWTWSFPGKLGQLVCYGPASLQLFLMNWNFRNREKSHFFTGQEKGDTSKKQHHKGYSFLCVDKIQPTEKLKKLQFILTWRNRLLPPKSPQECFQYVAIKNTLNNGAIYQNLEKCYTQVYKCLKDEWKYKFCIIYKQIYCIYVNIWLQFYFKTLGLER